MVEIRRGDVVWVNMRDGTGHEQIGGRPAVVVQNDMGNAYSSTTIIAPITRSKKKELPTHVIFRDSFGLVGEQTVLCEQITTIDKMNIILVVGSIDEKVLKDVERALLVSLALNGEGEGNGSSEKDNI